MVEQEKGAEIARHVQPADAAQAVRAPVADS